MPAEAKAGGAAGAKAFVRHYIELINHAIATGDVAPMQATSSPGCQSCADVRDRVQTVYADGGSIHSDGWRLRSLHLVPGQPLTKPIFDVGLKLSPQRVIERKGAAPKTFRGGKLPTTFNLSWDQGRWIVQEWERSA